MTTVTTAVMIAVMIVVVIVVVIAPPDAEVGPGAAIDRAGGRSA
ncbi:MAG: hypothetical protein QM766_10155 [Burkholderiaceae bacterium]